MKNSRKIEIVEGYVAAYNARDLEAILDMYGPGATMEDPVGEPPISGEEAIGAMYRTGFEMGLRLELDGRVRCAGNAAAFPLCASTDTSKLYIIDVFEFSEAEKVQRMRAYWSRDNLIGDLDL